MPRLNLTLLPGRFAVCRLPVGASIPARPAKHAGFFSVTQTDEEISIVCSEGDAPPGAKCEPGWRIFKIEGPFPFEVVGILVSIVGPLADAGVPIYALSVFSTDYVLVKECDSGAAARALEAAGHHVEE